MAIFNFYVSSPEGTPAVGISVVSVAVEVAVFVCDVVAGTQVMSWFFRVFTFCSSLVFLW